MPVRAAGLTAAKVRTAEPGGMVMVTGSVCSSAPQPRRFESSDMPGQAASWKWALDATYSVS
jgi:hypothetical protein